MAPWRISEQTVAMKTPDGEPGPVLQFSIDPANSAQCRLRINSPEEGADAYEVTFNTGGFVVEQVYQPRVLKPFHRGPIVVPPEPAPHPITGELVNPMTNQPETEAAAERREKLAALKAEREPAEAVHPKAKTLEELNADEARRQGARSVPAPGGIDDTSVDNPQAQREQALRAGVDVVEPSDGDRKGVATQPAGGQAGETARQAQASQPPAPNAEDQKLQRQGKVVDSASMKVQGG